MTEFFQKLDDHRILLKFFRDFDQNSYEILQEFWSELSSRIRWPRNSNIKFFFKNFDQNSFPEFDEFLWNSTRILIRILVASLSIQQFRLISNSSRIRWPQNFCEILPGFDQNSSRITWHWNFYEILIQLLFEFERNWILLRRMTIDNSNP